MAKPKIVILSDSLALPRKIGEDLVPWEDTYPFNLKEHLASFEIINVSLGGASIKDLRKQVNYYKILKPDILILQCGIVDAAPRAFGRIEIELIKKLHLFRLTKHFYRPLVRYRAHHYANLKTFTKLLKEIKSEISAKHFFVLGILPPNPSYEKQLPGVSVSIERYNEALKKAADCYIDSESIPKSGIAPDHHHLNGIGHDFFFRKIQEKIQELNQNNH